MAGGSNGARMDSSKDTHLDRKERMMDTDIRRMQVDFYQENLRAEAAAHRLARGAQDRSGSSYPTARIPRTLGALRRLVGTSYA